MRIRSFLAVAALSAPALAQHGDVGFRVEGGAITTWLADDTTGLFSGPERVFEGELIDLSGVITGDEPGYFAEPGTLAGAQVGFNIRKALRSWDVALQELTQVSPLSMTLSAPLLGSVTTPAADPLVPVPGLSVVIPAGGLDFHFDQTLSASTPGIYLLELELWTNAPGVGSSLPYWIVLNYDMPEPEHEAAVEWVHENLVPAPGPIAAFMLAGGLALRRRR
jgi:hypothetical protein